MSKYGWTLWASIQDAAAPIDFDFWSWGMEKYERAVAEFTGPDFREPARHRRRSVIRGRIPPPSLPSSAAAGYGFALIRLLQLGQDLTDDLRRLVGRKGIAAFRLCDLSGKVLDGMNTADEHVAQRFPARFRIVERLERGRDGMVGDVATACTRAMASWRPVAVETTGARSGFCCRSHSARASSYPPSPGWSSRLVGAASASDRGAISGFGRGIAIVVGLMPAFRVHGHHESAIGVASDVHGAIVLR